MLSEVNRGQRKYCSRRCYGLDRTREKNERTALSIQIKPKKPAVNKITKTCKVCGSFVFDEGQKYYCSKKCAEIGNERNVTKLSICVVCGKEYRSNRYSDRGKFCSLKCWGVYQGRINMTINTYSRSHGGKRDDLNNLYFRSSWEANYARYLNWLVSIGEIKSWRYEQKVFEFAKIKRGSRIYIPDFEITNNDESIEYHEIKGWMDAVSATKLKRMSKYYPDVKVLLIGKQEYYKLARDLRNLIPNWESDVKHSI